jgi:hypothetical protein
MAQTDARPPVLDMVFAFRNAQIIHVAARLGLADLLAGGPRTSTDLAKETDTHQPSLYRLLRALAVLGVVQQTDTDTSSRPHPPDGRTPPDGRGYRKVGLRMSIPRVLSATYT